MNAEFLIQNRQITTERLILRPFCRLDLADFFRYAGEEGVGEMAGWAHHKNIEESSEILDLFIKEDKTFAVCLRESNRVIGSVGIEEYGMEDKLTEFNGLLGREIGFVLSRSYWGQGIMPEAVTAVVDFLWKECGLDFLTCGYFCYNAQSKRVQEKCGFRPYRRLTMQTQMGTREEGVLNLLLNPDKSIKLTFSHPETLIYTD